MTDLPALVHEKEAVKIWIRLPITTIRPGPNFQPAQEVSRSGFTVCIGGVDDTIQIPPGLPFEIEEAEGRRLVAKFGGEVLTRVAASLLGTDMTYGEIYEAAKRASPDSSDAVHRGEGVIYPDASLMEREEPEAEESGSKRPESEPRENGPRSTPKEKPRPPDSEI